MKKGIQKIGDEKSYIPDETLVTFIQNWLQIHKKKEQLSKEGMELSYEDKKKLRDSDRMKVYILDNTIFPAFANLTYFFEAIAASSRLSTAFEDELVEMLDPRNSKQAAQFSGESRFSSMNFIQNNFARLIMAMLNIPINKYHKNEPVDDFRIGLMYQIISIIGDKMGGLLEYEYKGNQIWRSFWDDYNRMSGWITLLTRSVKEEPKEYDRQIGFYSIRLSSNPAYIEMDF